MRLTAEHIRIHDDILSDLQDYDGDPDGDTWEDIVEMAMNDAWSRLIKTGPPREDQ